MANSSAACSLRGAPPRAHDNVMTPATVPSVPSATQALIDSPRNTIAVRAANSGAVEAKVAAAVGAALDMASSAMYIESMG